MDDNLPVNEEFETKHSEMCFCQMCRPMLEDSFPPALGIGITLRLPLEERKIRQSLVVTRAW